MRYIIRQLRKAVNKIRDLSNKLFVSPIFSQCALTSYSIVLHISVNNVDISGVTVKIVILRTLSVQLRKLSGNANWAINDHTSFLVSLTEL
jgi:hypothetical protein